MKPQAKSNDFQSYPRRETAAQGRKEKDADNIRKVLCESSHISSKLVERI